MALTKTAFAKALGVSKSTISRYCAQGMAGHLSDGTIDEEVAREWVRTNIRPHVTDAGAGGAIGAGAPADDSEDDEDALDDIARGRGGTASRPCAASCRPAPARRRGRRP